MQSGAARDSAIAFLCGAAVLVLEILGARLISPYYGATVYVWSSVITVTLAALALGYAAGGLLADRGEPRAALAALLGASSLWLFIAPFLRRAALVKTAFLGIQCGALAAAAVLLAAPLACLGAVGPLLIRLRATELGRVGRAAGWVSAVSTAGSVAGALAAGFWLIPNFSVSVLLRGVGAVLLALAAFCWRLPGASSRAAAALLALALGLGGAGAWASLHEGSADASILYHGQSFYGDLLVLDAADWGKRILLVDGMPNTVADMRTLESTSDYIRSFELLHFMRPQGRKALLIGLGGGALPTRFARYYGIGTDVAEIDGRIVELAAKYFAFKPTGRLFLEDGRRVLERSGELYDFIVLDAFNGDRHPLHLFSQEAFQAAGRRLEDGGVLAINAIGYGLGPRCELRRSVERTLRSVFPCVRVLAASSSLDPSAEPINLTFFASKEPLAFPLDPLKGRPALAQYYRRIAGRFIEDPASSAEGRLLTDDDNPLDTLSAAAGAQGRRQLMAQVGRWALD